MMSLFGVNSNGSVWEFWVSGNWLWLDGIWGVTDWDLEGMIHSGSDESCQFVACVSARGNKRGL